MNIRDITHLDPNYYEICREERNYAAILFSALCRPGNAKRFLRSFNFADDIGPDFGIYFEYAYLRDLWHKFRHEELLKKQVLKSLLPITDIDEIIQLPTKEINRQFGVGNLSSKRIQNPGNWSIKNFSKNFDNNDDFLKICRFKWSFNIKPDIVIHLDRNTAICIEAKHSSRKGSYPSSTPETQIFGERDLDHVSQTKLQKYMMEKLLGFETEFMILVSKRVESKTHKVVTWKEAFDSLDMSEIPDFSKAMADKISK